MITSLVRIFFRIFIEKHLKHFKIVFLYINKSSVSVNSRNHLRLRLKRQSQPDPSVEKAMTKRWWHQTKVLPMKKKKKQSSQVNKVRMMMIVIEYQSPRECTPNETIVRLNLSAWYTSRIFGHFSCNFATKLGEWYII